jgi:hypothetical protein
MNDTPAGGLVTMESNTFLNPFYLFQDVPRIALIKLP